MRPSLIRIIILLFVCLFVSSSFCDQPTNEYYNEPYRPQFHFTPEKNWMNDPNGLVYYGGEYHLFYQHNPFDREWGFMHWGHAISRDLVHWKHLPIAIYPDENSKDKVRCTAFSGSAIVDWNNTSGFQTGSEPPSVVFYTSQLCGQRIAYSNDRGRTWEKYDGNPILPRVDDDARDPKVIWHDESKQWVMVLYRRPDNDKEKSGISFYTSANLKEWDYQSHTVGFFECPEVFELPVDGNPQNTRWILYGGDAQYMLGSFDGSEYRKESSKHVMDYGANFYASQTYNNIPEGDGRRIQIAWMRGGKYPDSPWNQQMSFPCTLTLHTTKEGIRVFRNPVREIETIYQKQYIWENVILEPRNNLLAGFEGDLFEIFGEFEVKEGSEFGIVVRKGEQSKGTPIRYDVQKQELTCLGRTAPLELNSNRIKIHILLDRTSIEVFGNDGRISMSNCFVPNVDCDGLELYTKGGNVKIIQLEVNRLHTAWRNE